MSDKHLPGIPKNAEAARREMIRRRQETSVFWRVIHMLGSLKLALVLLATIAIACAVATFYESGFNAKIAQHYIYKAPWFLVWLGVLCVNLFAVTLTRWPWQKKHTGFIITHYGIIILLIGAVIGSVGGFEGNVTLHKDRPPVNRVTTSRSIVQIEDPNSAALLIRPFDALVTRPRPERPIALPVPGTDWRIVAYDSSADLHRETVLQPVPEGGKFGVLLELSSRTAGRTVRMPMVAAAGENTGDLMGMARVELLQGLPARTSKTASETRMVPARYAPVSHGDRTGVVVRLDSDGRRVRVSSPEGPSATYLLKEVLGKEIQTANATVRFEQFWNDLEMRDGVPVNASMEMKNPAVLVRIAEHRESTAGTTGGGLLLRVAPAPGGDEKRIVYELSRDGEIAASGEAGEGGSFSTGWNDWSAQVVAVEPRAALAEEVRPAVSEDEKSGVPGFLARLDVPGQPPGEPVWIESGRVTTLVAGNQKLRMGYGLELRDVPFRIRLLDFEVPRFEGTNSPSNFIATVEFQGTDGSRRTDTARMNKPANWPGGFWPLVTGWNYKFSQAEWNPQDLKETTLQVLYDPGWLLKWIGSLAICAGIFILFYLKPKSSRQ